MGCPPGGIPCKWPRLLDWSSIDILHHTITTNDRVPFNAPTQIGVFSYQSGPYRKIAALNR